MFRLYSAFCCAFAMVMLTFAVSVSAQETTVETPRDITEANQVPNTHAKKKSAKANALQKKAKRKARRKKAKFECYYGEFQDL